MLDRGTVTNTNHTDEGPEAKRFKFDDGDSKELNKHFRTHFLCLSDDVLLYILSFLDKRDLISLSECSQRLANVCCDNTLWQNVDLSSRRLNTSSLKTYIRYLRKSTKFLATMGCLGNNDSHTKSPTISKTLMKLITKNAPNLETLILEDHVLDGAKVFLDDFPPKLERLVLRNCTMINMPKERSYFFKLEKLIPNLKILDLTDSSWFVPHSLLALSKSETLEELILSGCDVHDCLPYTSLAAQYGFFSLRTLDLRNTSVSDIEVTCFNRRPSLKHLYLSPYGLQMEPLVTDQSITSFGGVARDGQGGEMNIGEEVVIIEAKSAPRPPCHLETLVVRNYPRVTDISLKHAATYMKNLKYLDVSRTGVSQAGIFDFKKRRPDVEIVTNIAV